MRPQRIKFDKDIYYNSRYSKIHDFHNLMKYRVRDILLVSSLYDSYIFEEDFRLYELIRREYHGLNLSHSPEMVQVSSGREAIEIAKSEERFDLIITTQHIDDMTSVNFAKAVKESGLDIPVVLLGYDNQEMSELISHPDISVFEKVFIWQGDYRIILGIIKYLEDKFNVENDSKSVGVQVVILIEDSVRFYSTYLPLVYTEILKQSQSLISEGVNLSHKFLRMRARPKILLCSNYEEAWEYYEKYKNYVLGIISDVNFKREGIQDPRAGVIFAENVKKMQPDIPILLQSNQKRIEADAEELGVGFLMKDSPTLLQDLKTFIMNNFGFGYFVFKDNLGNVVGRARNLRELEEQLKVIPEESLLFHASRNHFSNWLKARTEFWLAHQLRPVKVTDFSSTEALRKTLLTALRDYRRSQKYGVILDFNKLSFDTSYTFARIGGGSIGGKARGLGFINNLLSNFEIRNKFEKLKIFVPATVVIGTDVFDEFLDSNNLRDFALKCEDDRELLERFIEAERFPYDTLRDLNDFLELVKSPLAVRSSSLHEDSQGQPFAGVYDTLMIPNNNPDAGVRLEQLINAVKRIYASTFYQLAKDYINVTSYRLEEEKMAVVIQKVIGEVHNGKFYPEIAGVAKSYNFYPAPPLKSSDGIVSVALGLGKTIVEGGNMVRFCPRYPHRVFQYGSIENALEFMQQDFFALDMNVTDEVDLPEEKVVTKHDISVAFSDGTMNQTGSTYSPENQAIYDGVAREGIKLFTLAPVLKYNTLPLAEVLDVLLELGSWGMGSPVEIEFAVNFSVPPKKSKEMAVLQIRPLVISNETEELNVSDFDDEQLLVKSTMTLGHGILGNIYDVIFVDFDEYNRAKSNEAASEIAYFNNKLSKEGKKYILVALGRIGSLDPWLGIPLKWEQISSARAIVESNFKDMHVEPSQGSHFFQNLTSFKVSYLTVGNTIKDSFIDWKWLRKQNLIESKKYVKHINTDKPFTIKLNGKNGRGIIIKPGIEKELRNDE